MSATENYNREQWITVTEFTSGAVTPLVCSFGSQADANKRRQMDREAGYRCTIYRPAQRAQTVCDDWEWEFGRETFFADYH